MGIQKVIVKKDSLFYQCLMLSEARIKCGKCLFGLINPFGNKVYMTDRCKRCGAELNATYYGSGYNVRVYNP